MITSRRALADPALTAGSMVMTHSASPRTSGGRPAGRAPRSARASPNVEAPRRLGVAW